MFISTLVLSLSTGGTVWILFRRWWPNLKGASSAISVLAVAGAAITQTSVDWAVLTQVSELRAVAVAAGLVLAWRYSTRAFSPIDPQFTIPERLAMLASATGTIWSPVWLLPVAVLAKRRRRVLEPCLHEMLAIHVILVFVAFGAVRLTVLPLMMQDPTHAEGGADQTLVLTLLSCIGALYFKPGIYKIQIGRRWYDWMAECRLHYQIIGAHIWGWMDWIPTRTAIRIARAVAPLNRPFAAAVVVLELATIMMAISRDLTVVILIGLAVFHLGYFIMTGALFWENMVIAVVTGLALLALPEALASRLFGPEWAGLFAANVLLMAFVFQSPPLTWWESPLIQRMYTEVLVAREPLLLGHNYMDPLEKTFYFGFEELAPRSLITVNLSHTSLSQTVVNDLLNSRNRPDRLEELTPIRKPSEESIAQIREFLSRIIDGIEAGRHREALPRCLRWLKAPGSFLASGGLGRKFLGEGRIDEVRIMYLEVYFDDDAIVERRRDVVYAFSRGENPPPRTMDGPNSRAYSAAP